MTATLRALRSDTLLAAAVLLLQCALAAALPETTGRWPDAAGWALLAASAAILAGRRRWPAGVAAAMVLVVAAYQKMEYVHPATIPASGVALYSLAVAGPPLRSFLALPAAIGVMALVMESRPYPDEGMDLLRNAGWIVAVVLVGEAVRIHRKYVAAIVERADRAERTREEEAARRVAEERMRIARDLHDLLAHTITLIGVQSSVAAHVLVEDPARLDRTALVASLDAIADTCRDARAELRTTLEVLRADGSPADGSGVSPPPSLSGLPDLVRAAEASGARVELTFRAGAGTDAAPPAVGAAAYRIVQEALTNAVKHAGPTVRVRVDVTVDDAAETLQVKVVNDDSPAATGPVGPVDPRGYGLIGMRERVRSVGGTLATGPRPEGGFAVCVHLPLGTRVPAPDVPVPAYPLKGDTGSLAGPASGPGMGDHR
ncbi:sensor histidine kinase [Actinacidiphila oryziradicis]|uniref:histidine kinase n=1 Tax=Actinacidiphila oryziradicis TaxID=2571141 RepID=A0A4V5N097_9ACTN|nr:histidine kinase [Actinacidiphila oryziradicis]TKA11199.1 sensor histidine kinase [Actinacidiphila oryziradicis]